MEVLRKSVNIKKKKLKYLSNAVKIISNFGEYGCREIVINSYSVSNKDKWIILRRLYY